MKKRSLLTALFILLTPLASFAQRATPDYYKCTNKRGGEWNFGRAPNICDAHHFIEMNFVERNFLDVTFYDPVSRTNERRRYMTEMNAIIKATAAYYIRLRKPTVSQIEVDEFVHASLAVAHQETYWSHYRQAVSGNTQFMRGDSGHGHGMMQIDDRWHFDAITSGKGAHLIHNLIYALDVYFNAWQKAEKASCVNSASNWVSRSRAAYSAYNGGSSRICRWTNPNDRWAQNDKGFYSKYQSMSWNRYVDDQNKLPNVDVQCLAEGGQDCRSGNNQPEFPVEGRFYKITSGHTCVLKDDLFHCVENNSDRSCLIPTVYQGTKNVSEKVYTTNDEQLEVKVYDRHELCSQITNLYRVGQNVKLRKNINLREAPGGKLLTTTVDGRVYQIIDFELFAGSEQKRYYKLKHGNHVGWIYSGDANSYSSWTTLTSSAPAEKVFAEIGDSIETKRSLSLFNSNDEVIMEVPEGTKVTVEGLKVKSLNNLLFYQVTVDGVNGHLFSGPMTPELEIYDNIKITQNAETPQGSVSTVGPNEQQEPVYAEVKGWYKSMRSCASSSCSRIKFIWGGNNVQVHSKRGSWLLVEYNGKKGYLKQKDVRF